MLIQLIVYLKGPLISTKNELQSFGSFWRRLYLEKSGPIWCGILNTTVIHRLKKIINLGI